MSFSAFGLLTSDPNLLACELARLGASVRLGVSESGQHAGLGSYTQDEVLLRVFAPDRIPTVPAALVATHESPVLLFLAQGSPLPPAEQPLRFGTWLFGVGGDLPGEARWRQAIARELPAYLQDQVASWGSAQTVFAYFLKRLRDTGRTEDPRLPAPLVGEAMAETALRLREAAADVVLMATNGHLLTASRVGTAPLFFTLLEGSGDCPIHRPGSEGMQEPDLLIRQHRRCRSIAIASHPVRSAGWRELSPGETMWVDEKVALNLSN